MLATFFPGFFLFFRDMVCKTVGHEKVMALVLVMELTFLTVPSLMLTSAALLADNINFEYLFIICQIFK